MKPDKRQFLDLLGDLRKLAEEVVASHGQGATDKIVAHGLHQLLPGRVVGVILHVDGRTRTDLISDGALPADRRRDLLSYLATEFQELSGIGREEMGHRREVGETPMQAVPVIVEDKVRGLLAVEDAGTPGAEEILYCAAEYLAPAFAALQLIQRLGYRDPLTGLYNRRWLEEELTRALSLARRHGQESSILMLDMDGFKRVNDRYGHAAGDDVLRHVSERLSTHTREADAICRYGGDEFVVLLPHTKREGALDAGLRLQRAVASRLFPVAEKEIALTLSFGISSSGAGDQTLSAGDMLARADDELRRAKK